MKLLKIAQSPITGEIWAEIAYRNQVLNMLITGQFLYECEIGYLMECDNTSNIEFDEYEQLSLTAVIDGTSVDYCFKRLYL